MQHPGTPEPDLEALRAALRSSVMGLAQARTHAGIDALCHELGLSAAPPGNKPERAAAAVDQTTDGRVLDVAIRLLARDCLPADDRNRLQDLLWVSLDSPVVVKRHRRELAQALEATNLYLKVDLFDRLITSLFVIDPQPTAVDWLGDGRTLRDDIQQHVYANPGDWSVEDFFEKLGVLEASNRRFALFVEGLVSPEVRPDEANQREAVNKMNLALASACVELRETDHRDGYG